jgi:hypothetical protein
MMKKTYSRLKNKVGTVKKSMAVIPFRWFLKKVIHLLILFPGGSGVARH